MSIDENFVIPNFEGIKVSKSTNFIKENRFNIINEDFTTPRDYN